MTTIGGGTGGGGCMDKDCWVDSNDDGNALLLLPSEAPGDRKPDAESVIHYATSLKCL